jgi:hypothetical protein
VSGRKAQENLTMVVFQLRGRSRGEVLVNKH